MYNGIPIIFAGKGVQTIVAVHLRGWHAADQCGEMNYDLGKQLRDAGFPQGGKGAWAFPPDAVLARTNDRVYLPTLSDLIEACGNVFHALRRSAHGRWQAFSATDREGVMEIGVGDTPDDAVARVWLTLRTKRRV